MLWTHSYALPSQCGTETDTAPRITAFCHLIFTVYSERDPTGAVSLVRAEVNRALQQQGEELRSRRWEHNVLGSRCRTDGAARVARASRETEVTIQASGWLQWLWDCHSWDSALGWGLSFSPFQWSPSNLYSITKTWEIHYSDFINVFWL